MRLFELGGGKYRFEDGSTRIDGNLTSVVEFMVTNRSIPKDEIDFALADMRTHGNDVASFGEFRGWYTASYRSSEQRNMVAELQAVESLRAEFTHEFNRGPESGATRDAYDRLMNLYMGLNVRGILKMLEVPVKRLAS